MKFVPKGPINNILALVQIMAWRRWGAKPLSAPMIVYWRIDASLSLNEYKLGSANVKKKKWLTCNYQAVFKILMILSQWNFAHAMTALACAKFHCDSVAWVLNTNRYLEIFCHGYIHVHIDGVAQDW